jgi:heptosyltransferase-2
MNPTGPPKSERVLIRAVNWVGDAVLTLPALAALRAAWPEARLTVLARPQVADVFRYAGLADEIFLYWNPGVHQGIKGLWRLAGELKRSRFERAILFQNAFEAAVLARLARIPYRAGYNTDGRSFLLNHIVKLKPEIKEQHQVHYYLNLVAGLGLPAPFSEPRLEPPAEEYEAARAELEARFGKEAGPIVGLAPGAAYGPAKCWFPERFARVADRLIDEQGVNLVLFGGPGEKDVADKVQGLIQAPASRVLNLAGQTTLGRAMALIGICGLFLTNDSGLMHVAAAQDVPVVAVFGSTNPATTGPRGERSVVIRHTVPCSPCLDPVCTRDLECFRAIEADEVAAACVRALEQGGERG